MKLNKTTTANLNRIWTEKVAGGATDRVRHYRITKFQARKAGYGWMHANGISSLLDRGLARTLVTKDEVEDCMVLVLVLTPAGRAAIGV